MLNSFSTMGIGGRGSEYGPCGGCVVATVSGGRDASASGRFLKRQAGSKSGDVRTAGAR